jgi:carboxyl-terminal processing protease
MCFKLAGKIKNPPGRMVQPFKFVLALPVCLFLICSVGLLRAQTVKGTISEDSLRRAIVQAVSSKLTRSHYAPKPFDDQYSLDVWERFIRDLDPSRNVFLQEDIEWLSRYKTNVDDEIRNARTDFFDTAFACWQKRIKESQAITEYDLKSPLHFVSGEQYLADRSKSQYPATKEEKEKLWLASLKYSVLRNYTQLEGAASAGAAQDTAVERKARNKVAAWYRRWFSKQASANSKNDMFNSYVNCITLEMDPHSAYTFPQMRDQLSSALRSAYFGIGLELGFSETDVYVKRLSPYGSAYKSGLVKENDRILAIADKMGCMVPAEDMEPTEVAYMIRGEQGSSVTMKLMQPGAEERTVSIKREELRDNSNKAKSAVVINNGRRIGYLYLPIFYMNPQDERQPGCSADITNELEKLKDQEVEALVFDLRGNGGGSLAEVVRLCANFIKASPISLLRTGDKVDVYTSPVVTEPLYIGPLAVLIDEGSASASEIFAAAMQDYKRALIIGTATTFGKGTAQMQLNMGKMGNPAGGTPDVSYGSIRLTQQKFYRASGASTQLKGVQPDIILAEKTLPNSIMEKDLPAALPADTIAVAAAPNPWMVKDYTAVIAAARQRVLDNASLKALNDNMKKLQQLPTSAVPLTIEGFRQYQQQVSQCEKTIQAAKTAETAILEVQPSLFTRINPALQKKDDTEEALYNNWLQKISKDLFLQQAVLLVQDMKDAEKK